MPTYDLACGTCGNMFERFIQRLLRDEDRECPRCGGGDVRPRITGFVSTGPRRTAREPRVTGFRGAGCCGGACSHHGA